MVFVLARLDVPASLSEDIIAAGLGSVVASILTYPAGVIGTAFSYATVYFGLLTPTEAVLFAAPLYIGAGYLQWYVLIPKCKDRVKNSQSS